ncbi:MAG: beta-lactamase family protein [Armatimonadetes bacterium]|nr:beta-lactamase family protein [Armatimonadota bacterium]
MLRRAFALALLASSAFVFADAVDDIAQAAMKQVKAPGMAVAVIKDGRVVKIGTYGYANLETNTRVSSKTVFEIGSVTKQFWTAALLQLVAEKKISLDDTYGSVFPDCPEHWKNLTVSQLLSHTSGVPDYLGPGFLPRQDYTYDKLLDLVREKPLDFPAGTSWSYSNSGFLMTAHMVEEKLDIKWDDLIEERIWKPLGMASAQQHSFAQVIPNRATGYMTLGSRTLNAEILRGSSAGAAGAIVCDIEDMAKWAQALLEGRVGKPGSIAPAMTPVTLKSGRSYPYGYGWMMDERNGAKIVTHGGNTYGQSAMITLMPSEKIAVVILSNIVGQSYTGLSYVIGQQYSEKFKSEKYETQPDPDKARTYRIWDALEDAMSLKPTFADAADELKGLMSQRGRSAAAGFRGSFGKIRSMEYVKEHKVGDDTEVFYRVHGKSTSGIIKFLIDKDGKLVRFAGAG